VAIAIAGMRLQFIPTKISLDDASPQGKQFVSVGKSLFGVTADLDREGFYCIALHPVKSTNAKT
jgi:hypothetical protein